MIKSLLRFTVLLISLFIFIPAQGVALRFSPGFGKTQFLAVGQPGFIKIRGNGDLPTGTLSLKDSKISGELQFKVETLDTGLSLRNKHLKEKYLKSHLHPFIRLRLNDQQLKDKWSLDNPTNVSGELDTEVQVLEKKKKTKVSYQLDKNKIMKAKFRLKISDFAIDTPEFMGVKVADYVDVSVEAELTKGTHQ